MPFDGNGSYELPYDFVADRDAGFPSNRIFARKVMDTLEDIGGALETIAADAAASLYGVSASSVAIGTGSKSFTASLNRTFNVGFWLLIYSTATPANYMHGQVTAYNPATGALVVDVTNIGGSGTLSDWKIAVSGTRGATGATGATGSTGAQGPPGEDGEGSGDVVGPASAIDERIAVYDGATGKLIKDGGKTIAQAETAAAAAAVSTIRNGAAAGFDTLAEIETQIAALKTIDLLVEIGTGAATITTGVKGDVHFDFPCTVVAWALLADTSGAIVIDIWKDTYANFPPTDADSITNGSEPEIAASGVKAQDTNLGDWTTVAIAAGDVLRFNVDSITSCQRVTLCLKLLRA